jgi:hypothetical protein
LLFVLSHWVCAVRTLTQQRLSRNIPFYATPLGQKTKQCYPDGRRCSDGAQQCCSPHCTGWQNITSISNGAGFVYAFDRQCEGASPPAGCVPNGGNCRRCRLVGDSTSDPSFPLCPACLCKAYRLDSGLCASNGYS